ncbi:MAG: hypothetical protein ACE3JK_01885 [Sporolactobacillus sp.]
MSQWYGTGTPETIGLRKKVANFGKRVASEHGDNNFPDWLNFKVGIAELKGIPYDKDYFNRLTGKPVSITNVNELFSENS